MTAGHEISAAPEAATASPTEAARAPMAAHGSRGPASNQDRPFKDESRPCDFRNQMVLTPRELGKLRAHQEGFVNALAGRLSQLLRLELALNLKELRTLSYQSWSAGWARPSHLTLFKLEPLPGVAILEITPRLGRIIVDRLMGGTGQAQEPPQELSEIERALLEQAVQVVVAEWCRHWSKFKELKPALLGYESDGRFVQAASSETPILVVALEASLAGGPERLQLGIPYAPLAPLVRQLSQSPDPAPAPAAQPAAPLKWNPCLNEVKVPVTAGWQGLAVPAREVLNLKIGDVLPIAAPRSQTVELSLGNQAKFSGRLGTLAGAWAVEILETIKH